MIELQQHSSTNASSYGLQWVLILSHRKVWSCIVTYHQIDSKLISRILYIISKRYRIHKIISKPGDCTFLYFLCPKKVLDLYWIKLLYLQLTDDESLVYGYSRMLLQLSWNISKKQRETLVPYTMFVIHVSTSWSAIQTTKLICLGKKKKTDLSQMVSFSPYKIELNGLKTRSV